MGTRWVSGAQFSGDAGFSGSNRMANPLTRKSGLDWIDMSVPAPRVRFRLHTGTS